LSGLCITFKDDEYDSDNLFPYEDEEETIGDFARLEDEVERLAAEEEAMCSC